MEQNKLYRKVYLKYNSLSKDNAPEFLYEEVPMPTNDEIKEALSITPVIDGAKWMRDKLFNNK